MSVPTWRRDESKTEFLYQIYQLNIRIGQMTANLPKKYHWSYGNDLVNMALKALYSAQRINREYMNSINYKESYILRTELCNDIITCMDHIGTVAFIYFEICKESPEIKGEKKSRLDKWEEEIGTTTNKINGLIVGLKKSDKERYNDFLRKDTTMCTTKETINQVIKESV